MLFLAVFLGFVAENIREHSVEKNRERQFIKSFFEDLSSDEKNLPLLMQHLKYQIDAADSLIATLPKTDKQPANQTYMQFRELIRTVGIKIFINDRTNVQLRNSGGMRLIQNKQVSDSIVEYYSTVNGIQFLYNYLLGNKLALRQSFIPLLNGSDYAMVIDANDKIINPSKDLHLLSTEHLAINKCMLDISDIRGLSSTIYGNIERLKIKASNIKAFIAKEYDL